MESYNFRTVTAVYCENCDDREVVTTAKFTGRAHIRLKEILEDDFTFLRGIYANEKYCYYVIFEVYAPNPNEEILCEDIKEIIDLKISLIDKHMNGLNHNAFHCDTYCK